MGMQSRLLGYIEEAWTGSAETNLQIKHLNEQALSLIPEVDKWPPLCRPMFALAPADAPMIVYKTRLIHLAASLKELDSELRSWLDKFEALLRQMYWESAYFRFEGAYLGTLDFRWRPTEAWFEELSQRRLTPVTEWSFSSTMPKEELDRLRE